MASDGDDIAIGTGHNVYLRFGVIVVDGAGVPARSTLAIRDGGFDLAGRDMAGGIDHALLGVDRVSAPVDYRRNRRCAARTVWGRGGGRSCRTTASRSPVGPQRLGLRLRGFGLRRGCRDGDELFGDALLDPLDLARLVTRAEFGELASQFIGGLARGGDALRCLADALRGGADRFGEGVD